MESVVDKEEVPDAQIVHTRSFVDVAAAEKYVPDGQVDDTAVHVDPERY